MSTLLLLCVCGTAGGLLFEYLRIPGGAMTGAMLAVLLVKLFGNIPTVSTPRVLQLAVYICLGIIVGNMFKPDMLFVLKSSWGILIISTGLTLLAGIATALLVVKYAHMDALSAYLSTSPGGLNIVVGLAVEMGPNAPLVLAYQMVRLYAILFSAPIVAKLLQKYI